MKFFAFLIKPFLNLNAWFLKLSKHNIYYLVHGPLRNEIQEASNRAFAYQHIENAIFLAKKYSLNSNAVILDVGGGTATTAIIFNRNFPNKKIYIFEPIKANFEVIKQDGQKFPNWILINKAVGNKIGKTIIHLAARITASSLLDLVPSEGGNFLSEALNEKGNEEIELTSLDHEISASTFVDILKIDVQGYELEVLKGATKTLVNTLVIVLELSNHGGYKGSPTYYEIDNFLRENNFELFDLLPSLRENCKLLEWDAIYLNKNLKNKD